MGLTSSPETAEQQARFSLLLKRVGGSPDPCRKSGDPLIAAATLPLETRHQLTVARLEEQTAVWIDIPEAAG